MLQRGDLVPFRMLLILFSSVSGHVFPVVIPEMLLNTARLPLWAKADHYVVYYTKYSRHLFETLGSGAPCSGLYEALSNSLWSLVLESFSS